MVRVFVPAVLAAMFATDAAADAPKPIDCGRAYALMDRVRGREREMNYNSSQDKSRLNFTGLGRYVENYASMDFDARLADLEKRYPEDFMLAFGAMGLALEISSDRVDSIMMESSSANLNVMLAPEKVYERQIPLFAKVRECDIAYNFSPPLGAAPGLVQLIDMLKKAMDREREQHDAHLQDLSDLQCTVRFMAAAQMSPADSPAKTAMVERYVGGMQKLAPVYGTMPPEQFKERLQGEMQDVVNRLQSKSMTPRDLVEEVHACENRFGMPVSHLLVQ